ncbi:MAG: MFS transporter [Firmicutes bacterium]|nr:MFS transporter [Bacillota bacterium]
MEKNRQTLGQRLFINRDFGLLFWGRLVSQVGDGVHYLALTWLVLDLTGSGTALGTMLFASSIPMVLLAPFTGVLADLWDRKTIVVSMDVIRGLIIVGLAFIYQSGHLTMSILYVATILSSLCGVLFGPAISATIPGLVKKDELVKANSLNNLSRAATMILGPVLGAFLLGTTGYFGAFFINGVAFLLSALSETFIRFPAVMRDEVPSQESSPAGQFFTSFKEGFIYIWESVGLRSLIFYATALNFLGAPLLNVVLPYFGKEVLRLEAQQYGVVQAMLPVGFLFGTLSVGYLTKKFRKESLLTSGITMQGLVVGLLGFFAIPSVYGSFGITSTISTLSGSLLLIGVMNTLVNVPFQVMLQETIPDGYRGRVYGLIDSIGQMLVPLSMALSGVLVDSFSASSLFVVGGLITAALGLRMAASPKIKLLYVQENTSS